MIVVVVGLPGSGKSTVADILREEGFDIIEFGDIWRELLKKNHIPLSDPIATREFTRQLRERYGKDIYAKHAVRKIRRSMKHIVMMGLRSTYEMNYLKRYIRDIKVIAIVAPLRTRYSRFKVRGKPEDPKTLKDFIWLETREKRGFMKDKREEKHGVMVLIKNADYVVSNTSTKSRLRRDITEVINRVEGEVVGKGKAGKK